MFQSGWALYRGTAEAPKPLFLHLEPTGACNLQCVMCPRAKSITRQLGHMPFELFERICLEVDPVFVAFVGFGEPLLHPEIVDMVKWCVRHKKITRISTNATVLDSSLSRRLIEAGLHQIWFSFDSPDKENFEKIRKGADFEKVISNISDFMTIRKKLGSRMAVTMNFTLIRENMHELPRMLQFAYEKMHIKPTFARSYGYDIQAQQDRTVHDETEISGYIKEALGMAASMGLGDVKHNLETILNDIAHPLKEGPCYFPYYVVAVSCDGKISPCCLFYDYQMDVGDLNRCSFDEIWNGRQYKKFRKELRFRRNAMRICGTCPLNDISLHNMMHQIQRIPGIKLLTKERYAFLQR
ncbi:MAG: radical SAM protein [Candidatus Omnitrophota bacterium]